MYITIGGGNVIDTKNIIGIFDLDITSQSYITREYLNHAQVAGQIQNISDDIPKSYLVAQNKECQSVILCQPASGTLMKRAENEKLI